MPVATGPALVDLLDAALPQTQCTRCGFDGCRPYAEALARGESAVNRCPPGGGAVIARLSALLGVKPLPLDVSCGTEQAPRVARIVEADCIGCARCIDACPTDAITGARRWMHAVIQADCSGCELCIPACPVDCIVLDPAPGLPAVPLDEADIERRARYFRHLYDGRLRRLARNERRRREALQVRLDATPEAGSGSP